MSHLRNNRVQRQDFSAFRFLVDTPATGTVVFPANGKVSIKSVAGCIAGTTALVITGPSTRTIKTKALSAGGSMRLDFIERGSSVAISAGFELYVLQGLGVYKLIAQN